MEEKLFLQIPSINIMCPHGENMIVVLITKRLEIIMSIQVRLFSRITFDYTENGGKAFLANLKHQYRASQWGEHDCSANYEMNGDYYGYPSLSHLTDEL